MALKFILIIPNITFVSLVKQNLMSSMKSNVCLVWANRSLKQISAQDAFTFTLFFTIAVRSSHSVSHVMIFSADRTVFLSSFIPDYIGSPWPHRNSSSGKRCPMLKVHSSSRRATWPARSQENMSHVNLKGPWYSIRCLWQICNQTSFIMFQGRWKLSYFVWWMCDYSVWIKSFWLCLQGLKILF